MVYFQTKIPISGKFRMVLKWKVLVCLIALWSALWPFDIFYSHLVYFGFVWYFFPFWYVVWRKIWQHCLWRKMGTAKKFPRATDSIK
jgi:hypothetical protein